MANWEKKSQYLLTEIVKYDSYIDSLKSGMLLRLKKRGEKALEKALGTMNADDDENGGTGGNGGSGNGGGSGKRWKGYPGEETIPEGDEPPPTPGLTVQASLQGRNSRSSSHHSSSRRSTSQHRRESAETESVSISVEG